MSKWHQFEVSQYDLREADLDLRDLFKNTHRWLKANASGKWKIVRNENKVRVGIRTFLRYSPMNGDKLVVFLKKERDVTLFKMFFSEYFRPYGPVEKVSKVLISLVRRVMPGIIANDILGVQNMSGPVGALYTHSVRYVDQKVDRIFMFGRCSPSQRRAKRRRLRNKGVLITSTQVRSSGEKIPLTLPSRKTLNKIISRNEQHKKYISMMLENTLKEMSRGR